MPPLLRRRLPFAVALLALLVAGGLRPASFVVAGGKSIPQVPVVITAAGVTVPTTVPTGLVALTFDNRSDAPYFGLLVRPQDGVTPAALATAFADEEMAAAERLIAVALGGPAFLAPGDQRQLVVDLAAGTYALASFGDEELPTITPLRAAPPAAASAPPAVTGEVVMGDFFFRAPPLGAGANTVRLANQGQQMHHMFIAELAAGVTIEAVLEAEEAGVDVEAAGLVTPTTGVLELTPGAVVYPTLEFTAGTYAMVCFVEDPTTGLPHAALGMVLPFTVP